MPRLPVIITVAAMAAVATAQWLTVRYNRDRNWSALYCTGTARPLPPRIEAEGVYRFEGPGFDGQFYHLMAHDPLLWRGHAAYMDDARLRYRRILIPAAAYLLALGRDDLVDAAYWALILASVGLGVYWCSRWAAERGAHPAWGLGFLGLPAVIASADRLTADVSLLALCAAFALYQPRTRALLAVCAAAPLVRETGLILPAAVCLRALLDGNRRRAAAFAVTALPFVAWAAFVAHHTAAASYPVLPVPLGGIVAALLHPRPYGDKAPAIAWLDQVADAVALMGILLAFVQALRWRGRTTGAVGYAGLLFAALGVVLQRPDHWHHVFDFGRVYSPLLLFLGLDAPAGRAARAILPTALTYPRIGLQLGSQVVGVVRGLLR